MRRKQTRNTRDKQDIHDRMSLWRRNVDDVQISFPFYYTNAIIIVCGVLGGVKNDYRVVRRHDVVDVIP